MNPFNLIPKSFLKEFLYQMKIKHHKFFDHNPVVHSGIASTKLFTSILDENTHEVHHVLLKIADDKASRRSQLPIRAAFANETHFYANVYKALKAYLDDDIAPRFLAHSRKEEEEGLVLDNLEKHGYQSLAKEERWREDTLALLMRAYGKLHGSSFALKEKDKVSYSRLAFECTHISPLEYQCHISAYAVAIENITQSCVKYLDEASDAHIREKFMKYALDPARILMSLWTKFESYSSCFLHGNARPNNFMFKFDEKRQPSSVRLVDFAHSKIGSPILDLSYCIYSNSSKNELDKLDDYLSIYHDTLSETLEKAGCNSKLIFPSNILKEQWSKYAKIGLLMALGIMKEQVMQNSVVTDLDPWTMTVNYVPVFCQETFKRRFKDLVYHMEEINAL